MNFKNIVLFISFSFISYVNNMLLVFMFKTNKKITILYYNLILN